MGSDVIFASATDPTTDKYRFQKQQGLERDTVNGFRCVVSHFIHPPWLHCIVRASCNGFHDPNEQLYFKAFFYYVLCFY